MPAPHDVISQLLSPAQAGVLDSVGREAWATAAAALGDVFSGLPSLSGVEGRLVMPEEIAGEFGMAHLVAPLEVSTDQEQTAMAYIAFASQEAAAALGSEADDPGDQEQQTMVVASTVLAQAVQAMNAKVFGASTTGLVVALDDLLANAMPELLAAMDEPALALTGTLAGKGPLPLTFILPGTFLDIVAGAMDGVGVGGAEEPEPEVAEAPPFSVTSEELEQAELIEEVPVGEFGGDGGQSEAAREPTPIAHSPGAQRARFAPIPDAPPSGSRNGIDLLAGLQMNVTVELGRSEMTVADVLGLGPGSVVELDRLAGEPVDILVNDRLIARGEVVVVDENFGVRVVEVVRRVVEQEERVS